MSKGNKRMKLLVLTLIINAIRQIQDKPANAAQDQI